MGEERLHLGARVMQPHALQRPLELGHGDAARCVLVDLAEHGGLVRVRFRARARVRVRVRIRVRVRVRVRVRAKVRPTAGRKIGASASPEKYCISGRCLCASAKP